MFDYNAIGLYFIEISIIFWECAFIYFLVRPKKIIVQNEILKIKPNKRKIRQKRRLKK